MDEYVPISPTWHLALNVGDSLWLYVPHIKRVQPNGPNDYPNEPKNPGRTVRNVRLIRTIRSRNRLRLYRIDSPETGDSHTLNDTRQLYEEDINRGGWRITEKRIVVTKSCAISRCSDGVAYTPFVATQELSFDVAEEIPVHVQRQPERTTLSGPSFHNTSCRRTMIQDLRIP